MARRENDSDSLDKVLSRLEEDNAVYWMLHPELPALISHFMAKGKPACHIHLHTSVAVGSGALSPTMTHVHAC